MKISDTTTQMGAIQLSEKFTRREANEILNNDTLRKYFISLFNMAITEVFDTIVNSNKSVKFDDNTRLTLPRWEEEITADTLSWRMKSEMLIIDRIEYLPTGTTQWTRLNKLFADNIDVISNYENTEGLTKEYMVVEDVIYFYPKLKAGDKFRIFYIRNMLEIEDNNFNQNFGFDPSYHILIPLKASLMDLKINRPTAPEIAHLTAKIEETTKDMIARYLNKNQDKGNIRMTYKTYNFK